MDAASGPELDLTNEHLASLADVDLPQDLMVRPDQPPAAILPPLSRPPGALHTLPPSGRWPVPSLVDSGPHCQPAAQLGGQSACADGPAAALPAPKPDQRGSRGGGPCQCARWGAAAEVAHVAMHVHACMRYGLGQGPNTVLCQSRKSTAFSASPEP